MMIFTIAGRELRSLFISPLAWSILAVVQLILAYMFLTQLDLFMNLQSRLLGMAGAPGVTEIIAAPLFGNAAVVLLLVVPMLTMRLVSEERRSQTLSLLFSAPLSMTEIVLGKFLGVMGFLLIMVLLIVLMPLSLLLGGGLDFGMLAAGALGLILLLAAFAAVGLFMSTLTVQPTIAAVSSFGVLLLLWIIDWAGNTGSGQASELFAYVSLLRHFESLLKGVFDSADVLYYLLFVTLFLVLSIRRLDAERLQH
ncbi:ABC transporter permease [Candidatus Tenderia electrophaga]|jgi:ABC-2 type transport system permease protein|uniref:ABC transporter permease n=1 Tax=Candidatus Tenderia electrophaga TaxID=1748243 RepID=A0A0S2T999_9GAMM|nr:ABC transporter permease [Candidatus Tenderia electrophaga]